MPGRGTRNLLNDKNPICLGSVRLFDADVCNAACEHYRAPMFLLVSRPSYIHPTIPIS